MGRLGNRKHEEVAQLVAAGMLRKRACAEVYPDCSETTAANYGSQVANRPEVAARIAELQGLSAGKATMALGQRLAFLRDVALTPYGELHEGSALVRSVHRGRYGTSFRMPDKLWSLSLYSKLAGDFDEKVVRPTYLGQMIARIRAGKGGTGNSECGTEKEVKEKPGERALRNGAHERFAQLVAGGEQYARSYTEVYGPKGRSAMESAGQLGRREDVRERIGYLQGQAAEWAGWPVEHRLRYLQDFIRLPVGEMDEFSIYCQGVHLNMQGREVRAPSKMQAIELYTKLERVKPEDPEDGEAKMLALIERIERRES